MDESRDSTGSLRARSLFLVNWRIYLSFFLLGLGNDFGYFIVVTAAHDIMKAYFPEEENYSEGRSPTDERSYEHRHCNRISTGAVLLAVIIPIIFIKLIVAFLPLLMNWRIGTSIALSIMGFLLVGKANVDWAVIIGIGCQGMLSGLGESSLLAYLPYYNDKNIIALFGAGTAAASILASFLYAGLTDLGVSSENVIVLMVIVPVFMGVVYWVMLPKPDMNTLPQTTENMAKLSFKEKMKITRYLLPIYMCPYGAVFLCQYFINQGLFELFEEKSTTLTITEQYRWHLFVYYLGVFIARSSMVLIEFSNLWLLSALQFLNVIIFTFEVLFSFIPHEGVIFLIIFWEGLVGGSAYVNTFRRISKEMPLRECTFSMAMNCSADAVAIFLAAVLSMCVHYYVCP